MDRLTVSFHSHHRKSALSLAAAFLVWTSAGLAQPIAESEATTPPPLPAEIEHVDVGQALQSTPEQVGDAMMYHKRYQAAIEAFKQASATSNVLNKLGMAYQMMLNLPEAVRTYQRALKLDPTNYRVMNNLGTAYDSLNEPAKAERMYREAVRLEPRNALFRKNLGSSLIAHHNYVEGWENYQEALSLDPKIFEHHVRALVQRDATVQDCGAINYYMAKGCARAGMHDCALQHLRKSVNEGFIDAKKLQSDGEFSVLLDLPEFQELLAQEKR